MNQAVIKDMFYLRSIKLKPAVVKGSCNETGTAMMVYFDWSIKFEANVIKIFNSILFINTIYWKLSVTPHVLWTVTLN